MSNFSNQRQQDKSAPQGPAPVIDVKEGTKVQGYGETFGVNGSFGTPSFSVPLPCPAVRGVSPELALTYTGARANSPFGLGFSLNLPCIARLTDKGIPRYGRSDRFMLSGVELTPRYDHKNGKWVKDERHEGGYTIIGYRPRIESLFQRIEWWLADGGAESHWRVIGPDNTVSLFGSQADSRISDPGAPARVFQWNIESRTDPRGNAILYTYRCDEAQRYPASVRYGNYRDRQGMERHAVEVVFDYGERDDFEQGPVRDWSLRPDPFSSYRPGFALRTARRCEAVLVFRHFPDREDVGDCLCDSIRFRYKPESRFSLLASVQRTGYRAYGPGPATREEEPPLLFSYGAFDPRTGCEGELSVEKGQPFPGLPGGGMYQFAALYGEALPGMLYNNSGTLLYWQARGDGRYAPPIAPAAFPIDRLLQQGACVLMDVEGGGRRDLVVRHPERPGFYRNAEGRWENYVPFRKTATELASPRAQLADLTGDGRIDLFAENGSSALRIYESLGAEGFDAPEIRPVPEGFPFAARPDKRELTLFANIFGDGLQHRVRLGDGTLTVWPNLGYGRFGEPITLCGVPRFGDDITSDRLFLVDLSGAGFDDLILVHGDHLSLYLNLSGNGFGEEIRIPLPQGVSNLDQINWADVTGDGGAAFVLSKAGVEVRHIFRTFAAPASAYLLTGVDNGLGRRTQLRYCSSTRLSLRDAAKGRPWLGTLSMTVNVIEEIRVTDAFSGLTEITRYAYTDGFYDPVEREFRGFGYTRVEEEGLPDSVGTSLGDALDGGGWKLDAQARPLVETRTTCTWNHIGFPGGSRWSISLPSLGFHSQDPLRSPDYFDPAVSANGTATFREARAALRSLPAASAQYGQLAGAAPYLSTGHAYTVTLLQPRLDGHFASFLITPRQTRTIRQEARPDSEQDPPAIKDDFILERDEFGNPLLEVSACYPPGESDPVSGSMRTLCSSPVSPGLQLTALLHRYANHPSRDREDYHFIGIVCEEQSLEISGVVPDGRLFTFDEIRRKLTTALSPEGRIPYGIPLPEDKAAFRPFRHSRTYHWNAQRDAPLPLGSIGPQGLEHHTEMAVFPDSYVNMLYGGRATQAMLGPDGCGYLHEGDYWWEPGPVSRFGGSEIFFSKTAVIDPFGAVTTWEYDAYAIAAVCITDACGQSTGIETDYRCLRPCRIKDINGNVTEQVFSPLGRTVAVSRYGTYAGRACGDRDLSGYRYFAPTGRAEVIADPERFLQGAGSYLYVDAFAPSYGQGPACTLLVEANRHETPIEGSEQGKESRAVHIALAFFDGSGKPLAEQTRVESVACAVPGEGEWTWITTEQKTYGPRGLAVRVFKPYYCPEGAYEHRPDRVFAALYDTCFFDARDRPVQTLTAKGFLRRTEYWSWRREEWDENDTVRESPYYLNNIHNLDPDFAAEREAIVKASVSQGTPDIIFTDAMGRDFIQRRLLAPMLEEGKVAGAAVEAATPLDTGIWLDAAGNTIAEADPRFFSAGKPVLRNFERSFDMLGRILAEYALDRGKETPGFTLMLHRAGGGVVREWNNTGLALRRTFDALQRPLNLYADEGTGEYLSESVLYGDDADRNERGQMIRTRDQARESATHGFDLHAQPLEQSVRFPSTCGIPVDWARPDTVPMQPETWTTFFRFNRRSWLMEEITPDGTIQRHKYYCNGRLENTGATLSDGFFVQSLAQCRYMADGNTVHSLQGNGVCVESEYEPSTGRLLRSLARGGRGQTVQDIAYTYDPVGNMVRRDDALTPPDVKRHDIPDGTRSFSYDSLYRLRQASGRQQAVLQKPPASLPREVQATLKAAAGSDATRLVPYTECYSYDLSGNLVHMRHTADTGLGQGSWTRTFLVSSTSNHAVPEEMLSGRDRSADDFFDASGNLITLPGLSSLAYDRRGKLAAAVLVNRKNGNHDANAYAYDASGERQRRVRMRQTGDGVTAVEETLYLGSFVLTRREKLSAGGREPSGAFRSVRLGVPGVAPVLIINQNGVSPRLLRFQLADAGGSVTSELDEQGDILTWEEYTPYGSPAISLGLDSILRNKQYRYIGKELDPDIGLYCIGQRYYIPWSGRWLTPDPAGIKGGMNLYVYADGNPVTKTDPSGTVPVKVSGEISSANQTILENDMDLARRYAQGAVSLLNQTVEYAEKKINYTPINLHLVQDYFKIDVSSPANIQAELPRLKRIQSGFQDISTYLHRSAGNNPFINKPHFNYKNADLPTTSEGIHTVASVHRKIFGWQTRVLITVETLLGAILGGLVGFIAGGITGAIIGSLAGAAIGGTLSGTVSVGMDRYDSGINLYPWYFNQDEANRAGTLVHEASHRMVGTKDVAYRYESKFANLTADEAQINADSYAKFAKEVYRTGNP